MIIDDILLETAQELNDIERKTRKVYAGEETKVLAEDMLMMINSFQNEVHCINKKWENNQYLKTPMKNREIPKPSKIKEGPYKNPFTEALENEGKIKEDHIPSQKEPWGFTVEVEYKPVYKWRTEIPETTNKSIEEY